MFSTGNPERDKRLKRAIAECLTVREHPTFGLVAEKLPQNFELDEDELNGMLVELKVIAPEPPSPEALEKIALPHAGEDEPPELDATPHYGGASTRRARCRKRTTQQSSREHDAGAANAQSSAGRSGD